jgi:hypothetical protein
MQYLNLKVANIYAGADSPLFSIVSRSAFNQDSKLVHIGGDGSIVVSSMQTGA